MQSNYPMQSDTTKNQNNNTFNNNQTSINKLNQNYTHQLTFESTLQNIIIKSKKKNIQRNAIYQVLDLAIRIPLNRLWNVNYTNKLSLVKYILQKMIAEQLSRQEIKWQAGIDDRQNLNDKQKINDNQKPPKQEDDFPDHNQNKQTKTKIIKTKHIKKQKLNHHPKSTHNKTSDQNKQQNFQNNLKKQNFQTDQLKLQEQEMPQIQNNNLIQIQVPQQNNKLIQIINRLECQICRVQAQYQKQIEMRNSAFSLQVQQMTKQINRPKNRDKTAVNKNKDKSMLHVQSNPLNLVLKYQEQAIKQIYSAKNFIQANQPQFKYSSFPENICGLNQNSAVIFPFFNGSYQMAINQYQNKLKNLDSSQFHFLHQQHIKRQIFLNGSVNISENENKYFEGLKKEYNLQLEIQQTNGLNGFDQYDKQISVDQQINNNQQNNVGNKNKARNYEQF